MTLLVEGLVKHYGQTRVLDHVDLSVGTGTVHALLGANGAGKSTLIKCLGGGLRPSAGRILLDGEALENGNPGRASARGIATIQQIPTLMDGLSVSDNFFLGRELVRHGVVRRATQERRTADLLERFQIPVRPRMRVAGLAVGTKQLLEIARAWVETDVRVLILDEPTSSLGPDETHRLFDEVNRMRQDGIRIVYTTHRLHEVFAIADDVTVLRNGAVVLQRAADQMSTEDVVAAIAGTPQGTTRSDRRVPTARAASTGSDQAPVRLRISRLSGPRFGPLTTEVRAGEILGMYGILGSGRTSVLESIAGRFPFSGDIEVNGTSLRTGSVRRALNAGVALVPEDRGKQAMWPELLASDNALLPSYERMARKGVWRRRAAERHRFAAVAQRVDLRPCVPGIRAAWFSGGNQQKLVIARWLAVGDELAVLLLDEPTQGVDAGAREHIYGLIAELSADGVAVVVSSSDPGELVRVADRVLILRNGVVSSEIIPTPGSEGDLVSAANAAPKAETTEMPA